MSRIGCRFPTATGLIIRTERRSSKKELPGQGKKTRLFVCLMMHTFSLVGGWCKYYETAYYRIVSGKKF
jgi:hypothetical protein